MPLGRKPGHLAVDVPAADRRVSGRAGRDVDDSTTRPWSTSNSTWRVLSTSMWCPARGIATRRVCGLEPPPEVRVDPAGARPSRAPSERRGRRRRCRRSRTCPRLGARSGASPSLVRGSGRSGPRLPSERYGRRMLEWTVVVRPRYVPVGCDGDPGDVIADLAGVEAKRGSVAVRALAELVTPAPDADTEGAASPWPELRAEHEWLPDRA